MTRPEWVEAGAQAVVDATRDRAVGHREMIEAVIAAVEPLIRADERTTLTTARYLQSTKAAIEDNLREQIAADIEAKSAEGMERNWAPAAIRAFDIAARIARGES